MIGDKDAAAELYMKAAMMMLGVAVLLVLRASQESRRARERARDDRRGFTGELATLDHRADELSQGIAGAMRAIDAVREDVGGVKSELAKRPARARSSSSKPRPAK